MASKVFLNIVADPNATIPVSLNLNLDNNGVTVNALDGAKAVLFNRGDIVLDASTTNITIDVNAITVDIDVDDAYDGTEMAVLLDSGESFVFTVDISTTAQTAASNGFDSVSSEKLRLWNLNG